MSYQVSGYILHWYANSQFNSHFTPLTAFDFGSTIPFLDSHSKHKRLGKVIDLITDEIGIYAVAHTSHKPVALYFSVSGQPEYANTSHLTKHYKAMKSFFIDEISLVKHPAMAYLKPVTVKSNLSDFAEKLDQDRQAYCDITKLCHKSTRK